MQSIHVIAECGKVCVIVDGAELRELHSFSLDYLKGAPLLFTCTANVDEVPQPPMQEYWLN